MLFLIVIFGNMLENTLGTLKTHWELRKHHGNVVGPFWEHHILTIYLVGPKSLTYLAIYCVAIIYIPDLTLWDGQIWQTSVKIT
jgi:hypothetical protein